MTTFVITSNRGELNLAILMGELEWARKAQWTESIWHCTPALVELDGKSCRPYVGQKFNEEHFKIVENFWTHEHCGLCVAGIVENDKIFTSDNNIICSDCYKEFILPEDIESIIQNMKKIEM
ncbi:hypothetical protein [Flagellimonas flava]|uniref:hypothetical protein n=1 Tax=Flagellimonas flava TaxID=570519 RepID=UPI003D652E4C